MRINCRLCLVVNGQIPINGCAGNNSNVVFVPQFLDKFFQLEISDSNEGDFLEAAEVLQLKIQLCDANRSNNAICVLAVCLIAVIGLDKQNPICNEGVFFLKFLIGSIKLRRTVMIFLPSRLRRFFAVYITDLRRLLRCTCRNRISGFIERKLHVFAVSLCDGTEADAALRFDIFEPCFRK